MSLREAVRDALKGNDTEVFNKLLNLRRECRERNLDQEKVNAIIRSEIYGLKKPKPAGSDVQPAQPEATPEPPAEQKETAKPIDKELSARAPARDYAASGLSPSGTRKSGASGGKSIVGGIL